MSFDSQGNDVDAAVERVLVGLREARAPEGLELRVVAAVRSREAETVSRGGVRGWAWAAAAVAVAAVVIVPAVLRPWRNEVAAKTPVAPVREAARPVAMLPVTADAPKRVAVKAQVRDIHARLVAVKIAAQEAERVPAATRAVDALALAEANAPSKPAPPEPLTAQERRLLRVAMHGTEEQRAALNPAVREQRYEDAKKAVLEFFEPPKPAEQVQE